MLHRTILLVFTILKCVDGSGTRRVVQTLIQLGVKMVSEDAETFDIHADLGKCNDDISKYKLLALLTLSVVIPLYLIKSVDGRPLFIL